MCLTVNLWLQCVHQGISSALSRHTCVNLLWPIWTLALCSLFAHLIVLCFPVWWLVGVFVKFVFWECVVYCLPLAFKEIVNFLFKICMWNLFPSYRFFCLVSLGGCSSPTFSLPFILCPGIHTKTNGLL